MTERQVNIGSNPFNFQSRRTCLKKLTIHEADKPTDFSLVLFAVGLNMQKQAELIREKDELDRLVAEMKLEEEEKQRWYAGKHQAQCKSCWASTSLSFILNPDLILGVRPCSQRQTSAAYQAELCAQIEQQKQLRCEERAESEREHRQRQTEEELYKRRTDELLSRPESKTRLNTHPFR